MKRKIQSLIHPQTIVCKSIYIELLFLLIYIIVSPNIHVTRKKLYFFEVKKHVVLTGAALTQHFIDREKFCTNVHKCRWSICTSIYPQSSAG